MNNIFQLKSKICILIVFIGIQIIAFSQTVKTVGTGTAITEKYPFNGYYNNSWASSIYTASEINTSGTLNSIAFYIDNAPVNYVMNNQRIYLKHTSANAYTSTAYSGTTDFTLVYDGSITYNGAGWKTINLTTPFTYNGQDNLEILFENRDGSWSSGFPYFRYTTISSVRTKRDYQDAQFPSTCYACATANTIPNIQLSFTNCTVQEGQITVSNNNIIPGNSTKLNLVNQSTNATIQWQESTDNVSFTNIAGAISASYTATIQQTKYFRAVVGINGCNKVTASAQVTANLTSMVTKTIGNGTVISEKYPFNNYYDFSWASTIYKSSEIGTSGNLSRIAFQVANTPSLQTFQNQKIYVKTTTEAIVSNTTYPTTAGFTLVYDGPITYNGSGWLEIVFNQQFYYNGTDNLEILFENRSGTYNLNYPTFYSTAMPEYRTKRDYKDASFPSTCLYCSKVANLLNVQMKFIPCSTPSNTTASVESICNSGDVVLALSSSLEGVLQWQSSTDNNSYSDISNATASTYTATNLSQSTYFRLKYSNGSCPIQYSSSKLVSVTSLVSGTISTPATLINAGDAVQINLANQTSGATIQWQESLDNIAFVDIQNSTQNSLTIPSFVESKYYRAKISKNNCVVYSNTLQLTINESAWSTKIIGTGTTTFDKYPFNGYYDYSWANMLYKASEINTSGKLTRVSFYVDNSPVNEVMNNQKIYVRHSSMGQFSSTNYPTTTGFTLVYDGSITYNGSGWKEIIFTTPFNYNGVDDLEFLFENRDGSFSVNHPIFRGEGGKSQVRVRRDYSDGSFPSTCVNCAYFGNILNIKMKFAPCSIAGGTISTVNSSYKAGDQVTVNLNNQEVGSTVQWEQSFDNVNFTAISGQTGISYNFTMPISTVYLRSVSTKGCSQFSNVLTISVDTCFTIVKTIGTGTSTTEKYPFNAYYNQSWSNVIYLVSEIGNKGKITSLSFNVKNAPANYISENQKIYVRHTALTGYADANYSGTSDYTLVYDGPISYNGTGWKEIILTSPFDYNGTDNLELLFENRDGFYGTDYPIFEYTSGLTDYRTKRDYADVSFPSTCVTCSKTTNVPNIRIKFLTNDNNVGIVNSVNNQFCSGDILRLDYSGFQQTGYNYQWQSSTNNTDYVDIELANGQSYNITELNQQTYFRVKVSKNVCNAFSNELLISKCISTGVFNESAGFGEIEIDLNNISDKVGPFNYVISREPIIDISTLYQYMKDSVFTDSTFIDSVTFFKGINNNLKYKEVDLLTGNYFVKVFDSRGKKLIEKEILISPMLNLIETQNASIIGKNKLEVNQNGICTIDNYFMDWTEKEITFEMSSNENQSIGLILNSISTLDQNNLLYGFKINGKYIDIYHEGIVIKSGVNVQSNSNLKISQNNGDFEYYLDNELIISMKAPVNYTLKTFVANNSALKSVIVLKPFEKFKRSTFEAFPASCVGNNGSIVVNFFTNILSKPYPTEPFYNVTLTDVEGNSYSALNGNSGSYFNFTNLTAGSYVLNYSNGSTNQSVTIEVPTYINWINLVNETVNYNTHSITNNHSNDQGSAESSNEMDVNSTNNYYVEFNLNDSKNKIGFLTKYNNTAIYSGFQNNYNSNSMFLFSKNQFYKHSTGIFSKISFNGNTILNSCDFTKRYKIQYNPSTGIMKLFVRNTNGSQFIVGASYTQIGPDYNIGLNVSKFELLSKLTNAGLINVTTNIFCKPNLIYAKLERNLKGVNYKPIKNKIYFKFDEEYTGSTLLQYRVFDEKNVKIIYSQNGNLLKKQGTTTTNEYGDNRYELSVASLLTGVYILEVVNDKKEKFYLRFTIE